MESLTMNEIKMIIQRYNTDAENGKINRERYRKTDKGKVRHNIASKKTYYRKKIKHLSTLETLTDKQEKQLKKWGGTLQTLENGIITQNV